MAFANLPVPSRSMLPVDQSGAGLPAPAGWGPPPPGPPDAEPRTPWHRYMSAVRRFRFLIVGCVVAGIVAGYAATRFVHPEFETHGTVWITIGDDRRQSGAAPIQSAELLNPATWEQLFRSLRVTDSVVAKRRLYLHIAPTDSIAFSNFDVAPNYQVGLYTLIVSSGGDHYTLTTGTPEATLLERGNAGDSIGRKLGFRWRPSAVALRQTHTVTFSLESIHQASQRLVDRATATLPENSQFMDVALTSDNQYEAPGTLSEWMTQFVEVAAELKRRKVVELTSILGTQTQYAQAQLRQAEQALESHETGAIARGPMGVGSAGGAGGMGASMGAQAPGGGASSAPTGIAADPTVNNYFTMQVQRDNLHQDIGRVQQILATAGTGQFNPEDLLAVPSLMLGSENLNAAIKSYTQKQGELRDLRQKYTDEYKPVRDLEATIATLQTQTIPQLARQSLARLTSQQQGLALRVTSTSHEITQLPHAAIEDMRLRREVDQAALLYNTLQSRYEEARIAQASAIPDVQILDRPVVPLGPSRNTKPRILFMALFGGLGFGLGLAVLLDRFDRRVRYPEQATDELGLPIIGTVPMVRPRGRAPDEEEAAQVVEAFRSIRLNIVHLFDPGAPVVFTITSPGAGEGKSLISSNLSMSFAESGRRTLLIDGDIRRGQLYSTFGIHQAPGVLDYLTGHASLEEVLQPTDYENLTIVSCGARRHRGPELLASDRMLQFVNALRPHFDAVLIDSPPLGAGIDPFALGTVTGNMLVVLRIGRSDRQMAQAKLAILDRYPIRLLGAVLNDVRTEGVFRYYSYLYGYTLDDGEKRAQLPSRVGEVGTVT